MGAIKRDSIIFSIAALALLGVLLGQGSMVVQRADAGALPVPAVVADTSEQAAIENEPLDMRQNAELLVDAIIQVESRGNPQCVGRAGERGLMQIKRETWRDVTRALYGRPLPFSAAFDPEQNRRVGKAYLAQLQAFLLEHLSQWRADERSLLLAAYNAGPTRLKQARFDVRRMPETTRLYVEYATALHDYYLADDAEAVRRRLLAWQDGPVSRSRKS